MGGGERRGEDLGCHLSRAFELVAWINANTARGFVYFSVHLPCDESEDTDAALKEHNQHHLQYLFQPACNSDKAVVRS